MYAKAVVAANAFSKYTHTEWRRRRRKERQPLAQNLKVWGTRIWKKPLTYLLKNELWIFAPKFLALLQFLKMLQNWFRFWREKSKIFGAFFTRCTVFENHRKSLIHHCERSELRLHFEWTKVHFLKRPKMVNFGEFLKPETCGQTVLPDRSAF